MHRYFRKAFLLTMLISLGNITVIYAQKGVPIQDSLYSSVLDEQRNIRISFPKGYGQNTEEKYDVIYVLDGEHNAKIVSAIHDINSDWELIPKCIIVGVDNKYIDSTSLRNRDLLPTHIDRFPLSGKADNYINFFKEDLIPYINREYPTTNQRTLFGHSHGGTFAIYTFLQEPALFDAYVAADPSLWWDDKYIVHLADDKLSHMPKIETSLFISGREGERYIAMGIAAIDDILEKNISGEEVWRSVAYPNETHFTIILKTVYDGLKFVYRDFEK